MPQQDRPDPESFLKKAQEEEKSEKRGKLKIYLGAAPGVGKTYSMLHDALGEREKGLDVLIGLAESHGRKDINEILKHFEILPRKIVDYHGNKLHEFDLEAALKRSPALIIVDEIAHTNAPGMRHKKRWQDVKELLDRGIDVYTALNVQHIESLNDDVTQIIRVPIKETVPDSIVEMADTIELIDLPPEDLIIRLKEGKVYMPEQANIASELFFKKGNLIALRELALRTVAKRVNEQVLYYRQGQNISQIWPTSEKILVCVGPSEDTLKLIRAAKRVATGLQAEWIAVYVDCPNNPKSTQKRIHAIKHLRLAEQLGAKTHILMGYDFNIVKEIMLYAHEQNVTQIMVWKNVRKRWQDFFHRSLADEILRASGEIDVYIMTGTGSGSQKLERQPFFSLNATWSDYGAALMIMVLITFVAYFFTSILSISNVVLVYLLGMIIIALQGHLGPSLFSTLLGTASYFFIFSPISGRFVPNFDFILTVLSLFFIPQIVSHLSALTKRQAEMARFTEYHTSALYTLSRQLSSNRGTQSLLMVGASYIAEIFNSQVIILMQQNGRLTIRARCRTNQVLDEKEQSIAQWVFELGQNAGLGTDSLSFSNALYIPLIGAQAVMGVLRIQPQQADYFEPPERIQLLEACANQIAIALEVDRLHEQKKTTSKRTPT